MVRRDRGRVPRGQGAEVVVTPFERAFRIVVGEEGGLQESPPEAFVGGAHTLGALKYGAEVESVNGGGCRAVVPSNFSGRHTNGFNRARSRVKRTASTKHRVLMPKGSVLVGQVRAPRDPFKVRGAVVGLDPVAMVDLKASAKFAYPCLADKAMHRFPMALVLPVQGDGVIARRGCGWAKDSPLPSAPRRNNPVHGANATEVAYFVHAFKAGNREPSFHVDPI